MKLSAIDKRVFVILFILLLLNGLSKHLFGTTDRSSPYSPVILRGFVNEYEVDLLNRKAEGHYHESVVGTSQYMFDENVRRSETAWIPLQNDVELQRIVNRAIKHVRREGLQGKCLKVPRKADWSYSEKLQIVRYREGGFYKPHFDTIEKSKITADTQELYKRAGPRISTVIIALSDPAEYGNGETLFPNLDRKYKLEKGDALMFHNINPQHKLILESFHGGEPLTYGEKKICNVWIHETPTLSE